MFTANIPTQLWGEAVLHVTSIVNVFPTKVLVLPSPYEKFHGHAPDYNRFQVFVSLCFYKVLPPRDKLSTRAYKANFLGFS